MRAALYIRVSTEDQVDQGFSIPAQINQLQEYCKKNNIMVYKAYVDEGVSGQKENRPQFQEMIKDASKKLFDIILVHKFDRFARKVELSQRIKRELRKSNVNVISMSEPIENSPIGFFQEGILELMAEYYVRNLAAEVRKGQKERASQGLHNGPIPLGYKLIDGKMKIDEGQAELVRSIFDMYTNKGYGITKIAKYLNDANILSAASGKWTSRYIKQILSNPKYIGMIRLNNDIYQGDHAVIIDEEQFNIVQQMLEYSKDRYTYAGEKHSKYFLLGISRCVCGKAIITKTSNQKYTYYVCSGYNRWEYKTCDQSFNYPVAELESHIMEYLKNVFEGLEERYKVTKRSNVVNLLDDKKKRLQKRLENLKSGYLDGLFPKEEYAKDRKAIEDEIKEIEKNSEEKTDIKAVYKDYWDMLQYAESPSEIRTILKKFIDYIEISPNGIFPYFYSN